MSDKSEKTKVHEFMHKDILTIEPEASLRKASQVMGEKGVGALLVKEGEVFIGIISEERLTRRGMAMGLDVETTSVRKIMREKLMTIDSNQHVAEARKLMKNHGIRHLVVKEENKVVGIITLSDLIRYYSGFFDE